MRLLVSVNSSAEAASALAGGADVIDAKDPGRGALGAVSPSTFRQIVAAVSNGRPVSAALGDVCDESATEAAAHTFVASGAALVKVGFAGITSPSSITGLLKAAVAGARHAGATGGVIAVAYADADRVGSIFRDDLIDIAAACGARGILLDTADKAAAGLRGLMTAGTLATWVAAAHDAGLLVAVAGRLEADDLSFVNDAGADIAGVRGAACDAGRNGLVVAGKVSLLRDRCDRLISGTRNAMLLGDPATMGSG